MSVLIKNMEMPKGCIYANDNDQTEYCPLLNHDDVPFCQYIESEPEIAIGIGERPVYCPLSDVPEPCENTVSRQAAIDAVMQYCPDDDGSCSKADRDIRELLDDIENLPSAQPDIVRCKDCKHWIPYDWMFSEVWQSKNKADYPEDEIGCEWSDMAMKANDFCSRGERRTE